MKKVIFKAGCVICVMAIENGKYANKEMHIDGAVNMGTLKSISSFIFGNVSGTMNGTICDAKSFGTKGAKTEVFDVNFGEETAAEEEE